VRKIALGYVTAVLACVWISTNCAAETTETIAIREVFAREATGWKRGDVDLSISTYAPYFTGYYGAESEDPALWRVCLSDLDQLEARLTEEFAKMRYDIYRVPVYFHVIADKALVVTEESGTRKDRATGAEDVFAYINLWMFAKIEDRWKITGFVYRTSPDTVASETYDLFPVNDETGEALPGPLASMLEKDTKGWRDASTGAITSLCTEEFTGYEGFGNSDIKLWQVTFSDTDILRAFYRKRFPRTRYEVSRSPVHFSISGDKALMVTEEEGAATHQATGMKRTFDRRTLWMLERKGGGWKVAGIVGRVAVPE